MDETGNFGSDDYAEKDKHRLPASSERRVSLPMQRASTQPEESPSRPATPQSPPSRTTGGTSTSCRDEFTGALQPLQVKIPADLIQSLKLHAIAANKTMSEMVLECLTGNATISKAWISTRTKRAA